jgi:hypothetical protein
MRKFSFRNSWNVSKKWREWKVKKFASKHTRAHQKDWEADVSCFWQNYMLLISPWSHFKWMNMFLEAIHSFCNSTKQSRKNCVLNEILFSCSYSLLKHYPWKLLVLTLGRWCSSYLFLFLLFYRKMKKNNSNLCC